MQLHNMACLLCLLIAYRAWNWNGLANWIVLCCIELVEPYKARPEVVGTSAKNMLARALGVRQIITKEQKEEEQVRLKELRG